MKQTRREFLKTHAAAATAAVAGITLPGVQRAMADVTLSGVQQALPGGGEAIRWDKAACRFCGTGCSVLVGVKLLYHEDDPARVEVFFEGVSQGMLVPLDVHVNCRIRRNQHLVELVYPPPPDIGTRTGENLRGRKTLRTTEGG